MLRRAALGLLLVALVGGAAADGAAFISGMHAKHFHKLHKLVKSPPPAVSGAPGTTLTPQAIPADCLSAAEALQQAGNFSSLLTAAEAAGLSSALSDRSLQATIFAPTDAAFAKALMALDVTPAQLLASPELLQEVLKYHVVPGPGMATSQLQDEQKLDTLLSADLEDAQQADPMAKWHQQKDAEDGSLTIQVQKVFGLLDHSEERRITVVGSMSKGKIVMPDINAGCPAVVQGIDNVLLPDLAAGSAMPTPMPTATAAASATADASSTPYASLLKMWGM